MGMDSELRRLVDEDTPKLNPLLANGLATEHMKYVEQYVDNVFKSTASGYPEGFTYRGLLPCTPQEEYNEITRKRIKRQFDVARSDVYYVKLIFNYKGTEIKRYLALPFVSDGGNIVLGGSRFNISPVISDRVISIGVSNIFVRLLRDRVTFERTPQHFKVNDMPWTEQVVWSEIYHKNSKMKKIKATVKAKPALAHYLFCKYGFFETFKMFGNCTPVLGSGRDFSEATHPSSEWMICASRQKPPAQFGRALYMGSDLKIAIKKSEWTPMVAALVGGAFYVVDYFPQQCRPDHMSSKTLWKVLMGHIIWSGSIGEGKLIMNVDEHLGSLDEYIDTLVEKELADIGYPVTNLYQLFGIIIEQFSDWLLGGADKINSIYDKQLKVLYYVMYEITSAAVKMMFRLKAASKKDAAAAMGLKKEMSPKEVIATMNSVLRTGLIFSITKGHGEVSNISSSGDNLAFKATANLVPQSSSSRQGNRKAKVVLNDPSKRLHVSVAEHAGYSFLPKSEPSGRSRLNLCSHIDEQGVLIRDPELQPMLDAIQVDITRGGRRASDVIQEG
jgi:hypothetical protein